MENRLIQAVQSEAETEKCLLEEHSWQVLYHLSAIRENILEWYPFAPDASLLEIGAECGALTGMFCDKVKRVVALEKSEAGVRVNLARNGNRQNLTVVGEEFFSWQSEEKFDYVTLIGVLGYAGRENWDKDPYLAMLEKARTFLKPGGKLFVAIENKYGVKYFAGAREDHTGRCFDGLENYTVARDVKTFSHKTLNKLLLEAGFTHNAFYYPMPDNKLPSEIYSEESKPSFGSLRYPCVAYDNDRYELIDERLLFDSICQDDMFDDFANAFLVVCDNGQPVSQEKETVLYAKYNRQRAPEYRLCTKIIKECDGSRLVRKEALDSCAAAHIEHFSQNRTILMDFYQKMAENGTDVSIPVELLSNENGCASFLFVEGKSLAKEVEKSLGDWDAFVGAMKDATEDIYGGYLKTPGALMDFSVTEEFEHIFGSLDETEKGILRDEKSLTVSNIDSILSNFVRTPEGRLVCLDYEWVFTCPIPVEYLIYRTLHYYYSENVSYIRIGEQELWPAFGIAEEKIRIFEKMDDNFQQYVHGENRRYGYTANYAKKSINIGKDIQNGESWFLSIMDDVHELNTHLRGERRDLIECHVKVREKSIFWDKCKNKAKQMVKKLLRSGR